MNVATFLQQIKSKCEAKANQMNALELQNWNEKHEQELKAFHGFTDKTVKARKAKLAK